jgi:hypothetical protein
VNDQRASKDLLPKFIVIHSVSCVPPP